MIFSINLETVVKKTKLYFKMASVIASNHPHRSKIIQEGKHLAHHESNREKIERACQVLNGQAIDGIEIDLETKHTQFCFDLGGFLETFPYDDELNEQWLMYCPDKNVFTFRSDGCYSFIRGDITPDKERWNKVTRTGPQHSLGRS